MPSLIATLGANIAPFTRGLEQAKGTARGAGADLGSALGDNLSNKLGAIVAGVVSTQAIMQTIELGSTITDLSNRLGISTDAVQQWDFALRQNGSSIQSAVGFFEKLAASRQKAMDGSEAQTRAFQRMGISLEMLRSMRVEDIASAIARTVQNSDPEEIIGPLREIGGRAAGELVPAFREGLAAALADAPLIKPEDIAALDQAADTWAALKAEFTSSIAPMVADLSTLVLKTVDLARILLAVPVGAFNAVRESLQGKSPLEAIASLGRGGLFRTALGGAQEGVLAMGEEISNRDAANEKKRLEKLEKKRGAFSLDEDGSDKEAKREASRELARQAARERQMAADERRLEKEKEREEKEKDRLAKQRESAIDRVHPLELTGRQRIGAFVNPALLTKSAELGEAQKTNQKLDKMLAELKEHGHLLGKTKF